MISTKMTGEETESFIRKFEEEINRILRDSVPEGTPGLREDQKSEKPKEETFANRLPKEPRQGDQSSPLNINKISFDNYITPSVFSDRLPNQPVKISSDNSITPPFIFSFESFRSSSPKIEPKQPVKYGSPSQLEDAVYEHLRELIIFHERLSMHLDTHKNCHNLSYVAERLQFLLCGILLPYVNRTEVRAYDNIRGKFLPPTHRGMRIIKTESHPVSGELVDGPLASLVFPISSEVNWTTPSHLVDLGPPVFIGTLEASRNGNVTKFCELVPSLCYVGEKLDNLEELVHLKDFIKEFEGGVEETRLEDPIVSGVGKFAVDAFNKACEMHVKKGEHKILQYFEVMECKYFRVSSYTCYFYIAIEAIEEGNPGAYIAEVAWNLSNGARSLCKFVLTDFKPYGTLATSLFYLSSLEALGKTLCDFYDEKKTRLMALLPLLGVTQVPTAAREADRLQKIHVFTMEDLRQNLARDTKVLLPPDCNRKTNPARWTDPDNVHGSGGMVRRVWGTSGYDYYNPYVGTGRPETKTPNPFK